MPQGGPALKQTRPVAFYFIGLNYAARFDLLYTYLPTVHFAMDPFGMSISADMF